MLLLGHVGVDLCVLGFQLLDDRMNRERVLSLIGLGLNRLDFLHYLGELLLHQKTDHGVNSRIGTAEANLL